jgi:integrase/recombinase XerD
MGQKKQARVITPEMERGVLNYLATTRWATRDTCIFLLSIKAGLRAKEIAELKWYMVQDAEGNLSSEIRLENQASKGKNGGRSIPMNKDLKVALGNLARAERRTSIQPNLNVIQSERGGGMGSRTIANWFLYLYNKLGFQGCSSHSGRRTFITRTARKVSEVGGSLRDVQELAGHSSLQMTQLYIESNQEAKRKLVDLV